MLVSFYQILAPLAALIAIFYVWNLIKQQKKSILEGLLWTIFWGAIAYIAVFPNILTYLSQVTGVKDQVNAMFISSIGILFFIVFYLVMRLEALERRHARLVRSMALLKAGINEDTEPEGELIEHESIDE